MTKKDIEKGKNNALIAYATIFGVIIAFYLNNDQKKKSEYAGFHIRQSFGLWLTFWALGYPIGSFDSWMVTTGFYVFFVVLFIYGLSGAVTGKTTPIPLVGQLYQKIFSNIGK